MRSALIEKLSLSLILCCLAVSGCYQRAHEERSAQLKSVKVVPGKLDPPDPAAPGKVIVAKKDALPVVKEIVKDKDNKPADVWTGEVKGWGATREDAEVHALKNARAPVLAYLAGQNPPFVWSPEDDFIKALMTGQPHSCPDDQNVVDVGDKKLSCWAWTVTITPMNLDSMRRQDVHFRIVKAVEARVPVARERMFELAKMVGWLVMALVGLSLYIRVDDWTKGTQRPWLRVALAGLLGVGGAGWWLLSW